MAPKKSEKISSGDPGSLYLESFDWEYVSNVNLNIDYKQRKHFQTFRSENRAPWHLGVGVELPSNHGFEKLKFWE